MTRQTGEDTSRIRATTVTTRGGETLETEREEHLARKARVATRLKEMSQMLRDEAAARAEARAELPQIREEIVQVSATEIAQIEAERVLKEAEMARVECEAQIVRDEELARLERED